MFTIFFFIFQIDETIKNIYKFLQKLAVGLEQVVLDQTLYDGHFMEEFNEAEFKLKAVSFLLFCLLQFLAAYVFAVLSGGELPRSGFDFL